MKKVAFHTLGCKVNQYETQAMSEIFINSGYSIVEDNEAADVYVINTCTVTNVGDKKSRQFIRKVKRINPESIIAVVGCYSQTAPEEVAKIEGVNIIVGTHERNRIVDLVERCTINDKINIVEDIMKIKEFEEMSIQEIKDKTRAFLKIQEGCNQYCSYCIIPYARGNIRSRKKEEIIREINSLVANGFKEIVLTGIHVASYGKDFKENNSLISVLEEVNEIQGLERIRLSSLEPTLFTEEFLFKLSKLQKVCQHFHLSLQSGSDTVLKRMNRRYTTQQFSKIVESIRRFYPMVSLTTDIIVGFPGETNTEFQETYEFVKEMNFSMIHVFKFSPRKGTPAADFLNQIDGNVKQKRSEDLIKLGQQMQIEYMNRFINSDVDVLFESQAKEKKGYMEGTTDNYIKVICEGTEDVEGKIVKVKLLEAKDSYMVGQII